MKVSNKVLGAVAAAGLALGAVSGSAAAEERSFGYTWTITGASDYLFRGISYTGSDPTINSYLEFTYGIAYLGLWTSNIDTGSCAGCLGPFEQDFYLGIRPVTGPINWDIAAFYYTYAVKSKGSGLHWTDLDYVELKATASATPITNLTVTVSGYYTPDQDIASPENVSVEGTLAYTLPAVGIFTPTVSGQVGFSDADTNAFYGTSATGTGYWNGDDSYTYWNAGVKLAVEKFTFDLRYWDTNIETDAIRDKNSDERFFFSAAVTLP
jgi:uncharacterized protein (TIGR02001 family)